MTQKFLRSEIIEDLENLKIRSRDEIEKSVSVVTDPYKAVIDSHAVAILTEWEEFKNYDWNKNS